MLTFSSDSINFQYQVMTHLKAVLKVSNNSHSYLCFKMKVNRPKFYLVKPSRQSIQPLQHINIQITLHQDGVSQAFSDKFKFFYKFVQHPTEQILVGLDKSSGVQTVKIPIHIANLPHKYMKDSAKSSEVKTINNFMVQSGNWKQTSIQSLIAQKKQKIVDLNNQISQIKSSQINKIDHPSQTTSWKAYGFILIIGMIGGVVSSMWI